MERCSSEEYFFNFRASDMILKAKLSSPTCSTCTAACPDTTKLPRRGIGCDRSGQLLLKGIIRHNVHINRNIIRIRLIVFIHDLPKDISVRPAELFAQNDIDGGLVGGASLKPDFGKIVNYNK